MPKCCALLMSGTSLVRGLRCSKSAAATYAGRCSIHHRKFVADPNTVALGELEAFRRRFLRVMGMDWVWEFDDFMAERIVEMSREGHNVQLSDMFPYGPAIPERFMVHIRAEVEDDVVVVPDVVPVRPRRARAAAVPVPVVPVRPRRARAAPVPVPVVPPPETDLAKFATDKQNIHTRQSVNMTKEVVQKVLSIPVPAEFRWNMNTISKTAGEILVDCKLNTAEMIEMMNRYIKDDDVYEMGNGIYGKVLDGVWQYIRNSPDKADLCKILKQELKDNIGMCAQGNLTRLCNVLSGYMDGIGVSESPAERVGRLLPLLMDIEDAGQRMTMGKQVLMESGMEEGMWGGWLEALAA